MTNPKNEDNKPVLKNGIPVSDDTSKPIPSNYTIKGGISVTDFKRDIPKTVLYVPSGQSFDSLSTEGVSQIVIYNPSKFSINKNDLEGISEIRIIPPKKTYNEIGDMGTASDIIREVWKNAASSLKTVKVLDKLGKVPVVSIGFEAVQDTLTGWNGGKGGFPGAVYGLGKGVFSGVISSTAGIVGGGISGLGGFIVSGGNPVVTLSSAILGGMFSSDRADKWADKQYDKLGNLVKDVGAGVPNLTKEAIEYLRLHYPDKNYTHSGLSPDLGLSNKELLPTSPNSFYDPVTGKVNTDPTQRVLGKNDMPSPSDITAPSTDPLQGAVSQPFNREKPPSTPNADKIKDVLYGSVKQAAASAIGFGVGLLKNKLYGRDMKKVEKYLQKAKQYYNLTKTVMNTFAKNTWNAASKAVQAFANAAWQSIAQTAFGQAIGGAVAWAGAQLAAMWGAMTAIPFIGGAIAAVGAAVSWVAGIAFAALFAW